MGVVVLGVIGAVLWLSRTDKEMPAPSEAVGSGEETASKAATCCKAGDTTPPMELVKQVPKGGLHSHYPD
jgi:hypothetical protein